MTVKPVETFTRGNGVWEPNLYKVDPFAMINWHKHTFRIKAGQFNPVKSIDIGYQSEITQNDAIKGSAENNTRTASPETIRFSFFTPQPLTTYLRLKPSLNISDYMYCGTTRISEDPFILTGINLNEAIPLMDGSGFAPCDIELTFETQAALKKIKLKNPKSSRKGGKKAKKAKKIDPILSKGVSDLDATTRKDQVDAIKNGDYPGGKTEDKKDIEPGAKVNKESGSAADDTIWTIKSINGSNAVIEANGVTETTDINNLSLAVIT